MRVDTVHSGDRDGEKGAYVINMVDEVTQYQQLASVRRITGQFMVPALEALVCAFPFRVLAFHSDSEFINHRVAEMLNKLHVEDFTKSRARRSNDNALVESKNGNVVRRWLGHSHIPERLAPRTDAFLRDHLSPLLNHHRACLFAVKVEGADGRRQRKYPQELVMTPYEKLRSLDGAEGFLKPGHHLRQAGRRRARRDQPGGRPGSPAGPQGAVPAHRQGDRNPGGRTGGGAPFGVGGADRVRRAHEHDQDGCAHPGRTRTGPVRVGRSRVGAGRAPPTS